MPNYISKHQVRSDRRGGGVSIYIHSSIKFKERPDFSIISKDIETLTLEILSDKTRNILANVLYRPPLGQYEQFENFLTTFFSQTKNCNKDIHIAGDSNLNLLDHDTNKKVQNFLNLIYQNNLISTINKPTRVTMKTATAIDHILSNYFVDTDFKSAIFKTDIAGHFPVCLLLPLPSIAKSENETTSIYKRTFISDSIEMYNKNCMKLIGKKLKRIKILMKSTKFF